MSAEEFWRDDPQLFVSYRTFYIEKKKQEAEQIDYECWLLGNYIHRGNGNLVGNLMKMLSGMFSKHKDTRELPTYPEKPYLQIDKERKEKLDSEIKEKKKKEMYDRFQKTLMYQGSLKRRYLESIKNKDKIK
jgi:hypothetical protein